MLSDGMQLIVTISILTLLILQSSLHVFIKEIYYSIKKDGTIDTLSVTIIFIEALLFSLLLWIFFDTWKA